MISRIRKRDGRPTLLLLVEGLPQEATFAMRGRFRLGGPETGGPARAPAPDLVLLDCIIAARADWGVLSRSRAIAVVGDFTLQQRVRDCGRPFLLLLGERDRRQIAPAEALRDRLSDARLIRFPDLGPGALREEPELLSRVLRNQFDELPATRS